MVEERPPVMLMVFTVEAEPAPTVLSSASIPHWVIVELSAASMVMVSRSLGLSPKSPKKSRAPIRPISMSPSVDDLIKRFCNASASSMKATASLPAKMRPHLLVWTVTSCTSLLSTIAENTPPPSRLPRMVRSKSDWLWMFNTEVERPLASLSSSCNAFASVTLPPALVVRLTVSALTTRMAAVLPALPMAAVKLGDTTSLVVPSMLMSSDAKALPS